MRGCDLIPALAVSALLAASPGGGAALAAPPPALTAEAVRGVEIRMVHAAAGKVKLLDGIYEEPGAPGAAPSLRVRLDERIALGDLDGDGADDAAVVVVTERAGAAVSADLLAIVSRGGAPRHAATAHLGERVRVEALAVERRRIRIRFLRWPRGEAAPDAPLAAVLEEFVLAGDRLDAPGAAP